MRRPSLIRWATPALVSAVVALLAAPMRGPAAAHCAAPGAHQADSGTAHHSPVPGGEHQLQTEDSDPGSDCPHCPPVQCGSQVSCSPQVTDLTVEHRGSPPAVGSRVVSTRYTATPRSHASPPPTPPPQLVA